MDSLGIGAMPDAAKYSDTGSNTLGSIYRQINGFNLSNLQALGLGNIDGIKGPQPVGSPIANYGKMAEASPGKDTTTGHWEIAGIVLKNPFPVYPGGFPREITDRFEVAAGTKILGNVAASGTEIIERLGEKHIITGYPIVYTSADSVFQIAAHEEVVPVQKLYEMCRKARKILTGKHGVARVIARPFRGTKCKYVRTSGRHDFSLEPPGDTILDIAKKEGLEVKAIGKIRDIFAGCGITEWEYTKSNMQGVDKTIAFLKQPFDGILFTNLVDFDMLYGHRNDVYGYAKALEALDRRIPEILENLNEGDLLFLTADHGCDPATESTDHSREYVPLLVYGKGKRNGKNLGTRTTFSDVSATISGYLNISPTGNGRSFLCEINKGGKTYGYA